MSRGNGLDKGLTNYGDPEFSRYLRRSFAKSMGYSGEMLERPIIGIATSASGFNNCHRLTPELVEAVKRGVLASGGLPFDFPTISLGEVFLSPTSLVFRNLMSMDVEEMIRAQPMDSVVLIGGCDKTGPAQVMGAVSAAIPAIQLVVGPMMTGRYRGERLGACTDCRRFWARHRSGDVTAAGDHGNRRQPGGDGRHVRRDGYRQHDGVPVGSARHQPAGKRRCSRRARGPSPDRRGLGRARRSARGVGSSRWIRSSRANRSRTRSGCCWPSAAPPMPSFTWRPSRVASDCPWTCTI